MGLIYEVFLPDADVDVVVRHLDVHVNGVVNSYKVGPKDKSFVLPPLEENSTVSIILTDEDDAGNLSDPSEPYNFDTKDTIKPKAPGVVSVVLLEEVAVAETEPAPVVETPAPEVVVETPAPAEDTVDLPPDHEIKFL